MIWSTIRKSISTSPSDARSDSRKMNSKSRKFLTWCWKMFHLLFHWRWAEGEYESSIHWHHLRELSIWSKFSHPRVHRHTICILIGVTISFSGGYWAEHPHWSPTWLPVTVAYILHGFGMVPIFKHSERLWAIFMGE